MKLSEIKLTNPYLNLPQECYTRVKPTPLNKTFLMHANADMAKMLDIDVDELTTESFVKLINGEFQVEGSDTFAMCYAGHQFGHFVSRLGDGRAINIGTISTSIHGEQHLQLKGAGQTKYHVQVTGVRSYAQAYVST